MMWRRAVLGVVVAATLAACGSSTAPGGISVGGHWRLTVSSLDGGNHVCNGSFDVNFAQSFGTFNGTYSSGTMVCVTNSVNTQIAQASGSVTDGNVNGQSVSFSLAPEMFTGTVNVSHMSGATTWTHDFQDGNGPVTLNGSWTADKQ